MLLSLQEAADLARVNKSTLFRAMKAGKVSATRDEHGQWRLDPAEVSRVYPIAAADAQQQRALPRNRDRTDELVAQLREQLADMRNALDRARTDADTARIDAQTWRNAFETEHKERLALAAPKSGARITKRRRGWVDGAGWWRRLGRAS